MLISTKTNHNGKNLKVTFSLVQNLRLTQLQTCDLRPSRRQLVRYYNSVVERNVLLSQVHLRFIPQHLKANCFLRRMWRNQYNSDPEIEVLNCRLSAPLPHSPCEGHVDGWQVNYPLFISHLKLCQKGGLDAT